MKRPALFIGFPYVLGLALAALIPGGARLPFLGCLLVPGLAVLIWRRDLWKYVVLSTLSCLTACCVYWHADASAVRLSRFAGTDCVYTGTVTDAVTYDGGYANYTLDGAFPDGTPARAEWLTRAAVFSYGDTVTLSGSPQGFSSGYLFDSAAKARSQKIFLQFGFDTRVTDLTVLQKPTLRSVIRHWRDTMVRRIRSRMDEDTGAVLTGLLFGEKAGMSRASRTALYRMGIGHVMVVSGLHLDAVAYAAALLLQKLRAGRKTGFAVICMLCVLFVLTAGETVSVQRACIMALIGQSGRVFFRKPDHLNSLSIAMLVLGLENPFVIHAASFWLSCTATFGIAVLAPYMTQNLPRKTFVQSLSADFFMCCWCFLAVLPVSILYFREISLLSPVSNTLLVPVCLGAMVLGVLALPFGCHGVIADFLLGGADVMIEWILRLSCAVSGLSWTHAPTGSPAMLVTVSAGLALTCAVLILTKSRRAAAFAVLCAMLVSAVTVTGERIAKQDDLRCAVLGEGSSTVLVVHNGYDALIFDITGQTGLPAYAEACLTEQGIRRVEALCLCKPSAKSAKNYTKRLTYFAPETIWKLQDKDCGDVLGKAPAYADELRLSFHGADILAAGQTVTVTYAGNTCAFGTDAERCTELTLTHRGTCQVRRLYGEN